MRAHIGRLCHHRSTQVIILPCRDSEEISEQMWVIHYSTGASYAHKENKMIELIVAQSHTTINIICRTDILIVQTALSKIKAVWLICPTTTHQKYTDKGVCKLQYETDQAESDGLGAEESGVARQEGEQLVASIRTSSTH